MVSATLRTATPATAVTAAVNAATAALKQEVAKEAAPAATTPANAPTIDVEARVVSQTPADLGADILGAPQTNSPEDEPTPAAQPQQAPQQEGTTTAIARPMEHIAGFEGEFDNSDVKFPQIKIVQGSGPAAERFAVGSIILGDEVLFPPPIDATKPTPSIRVVPVAIWKWYQENLDDAQVKAGLTPRRADTVQQMMDMGGSLRSEIQGQRAPWAKGGKLLFLVEKPEGCDNGVFGTELDGKLYCAAVHYTRGANFGNTVGLVYNTASTSMREPILGPDGKPRLLPSGRPETSPCIFRCFWNLDWRKTKRGDYTVWAPNMRCSAAQKAGPELREYCTSLLGNTSTLVKADSGE